MSAATFATINPATAEQIEAFSYHTASEIEASLRRAENAFRSFRNMSMYKRAQLFSSLAEMLRRDKASLARTITTEMGKILVRQKPRSRSVHTKRTGMCTTPPLSLGQDQIGPFDLPR